MPARRIVIATHNAHKTQEFRQLLGAEWSVEDLSTHPDIPAPVEDGATFEENATIKALHGSARLGPEVLVVADDSGLEVDALNGAPGVHSARFAALDAGTPKNSPDADNNARLLRLLKDVPPDKRTARFRCVVALTPVSTGRVENSSPVCYADEFEMLIRLFEGACEGRIGFAPKGQGGFGYDPLFTPEGFDRTFAELNQAEKNRISHRGKALAILVDRLSTARHTLPPAR